MTIVSRTQTQHKQVAERYFRPELKYRGNYLFFSLEIFIWEVTLKTSVIIDKILSLNDDTGAKREGTTFSTHASMQTATEHSCIIDLAPAQCFFQKKDPVQPCPGLATDGVWIFDFKMPRSRIKTITKTEKEKNSDQVFTW